MGPESEFDRFKDEYLKNRKDISTYRKLKKYSRVGPYVSVFLLYMLLALYSSNDFSVTGIPFISAVIITLIAIILTTIFRLNLKNYDFEDYEMVYHEIALFIDDIQTQSDDDDLRESLERFETYVINKSEDIIPKVWKTELEFYVEYVKNEGDLGPNEEFRTIFVPFIKSISELAEVEINTDFYSEAPDNTDQNVEPGFISILVDSLKSDIITKEMVIWTVFLLAVAGGLLLAFIQGQGWGVLLVTIVFGGLRLYDRRGE